MHSQARAHWHGVGWETRARSETPCSSISTFVSPLHLKSVTSSAGTQQPGTAATTGCPCVNTHTPAYLPHPSAATRKQRGIIPASYLFGVPLTSASMRPPRWRQTPPGYRVSLITPRRPGASSGADASTEKLQRHRESPGRVKPDRPESPELIGGQDAHSKLQTALLKKEGKTIRRSRFPPPIPNLILCYALVLHSCYGCEALLLGSYKLKRHPAEKTDSAALKADTQTQGQFMKINEVSVREFKWKSSLFSGLWGSTRVCLGDV